MEQKEKKKEKGYVLCTHTIKELKEKTAPLLSYDRYTLYEKVIDRSDLPEEQQRLQLKNKWYTTVNQDLRLSDENIYHIVERNMYKEILNGCKENLESKVFDSVINAEIRLVAVMDEREDGSTYINIIFEKDKQPDTYYQNLEYLTDLNEFEEKLKNAKKSISFSDIDDDYVWLEKVHAGTYQYNFDDMNNRITKMIKKFMRKNLTYCVKQGKIIVPDEYLEKGIIGIEEWRSLKSSNNKSNSMEKQILKQAFADKKRLAHRNMSSVISSLTRSSSWSVPVITVDGQWNQSKIDKLVTQVAGTKDRQKFMEKTDKEIFEEFKEYWKNKLMEKYNEIDNTIMFKPEDL